MNHTTQGIGSSSANLYNHEACYCGRHSSTTSRREPHAASAPTSWVTGNTPQAGDILRGQAHGLRLSRKCATEAGSGSPCGSCGRRKLCGVSSYGAPWANGRREIGLVVRHPAPLDGHQEDGGEMGEAVALTMLGTPLYGSCAYVRIRGGGASFQWGRKKEKWGEGGLARSGMWSEGHSRKSRGRNQSNIYAQATDSVRLLVQF